MCKGKGGGIRLLDHFELNKSVLSDNEQNEILTALQSLNVIKYPDVDHVISKLEAIFNKNNPNWIDVDFSHWGSHDKETFNLLKTSIANKRIINFNYSSTYLQPSAAYRVYDEFDENDIMKNEDGSFTVMVSYPEDEWVYVYILSFGSYAEVVEPQYVRNIICKRLEETLLQYR
jgi:predicted DNA-binding transcriptional regulator YafY